MQNSFKTWYLAQAEDGLVKVWIELDLTPFLVDGLTQYAAQETACEVFERNCNNFISW
jgi:hypothetical protein